MSTISTDNSAKPKRKGISKKTRFEVFKRDGFTCQYCGSHPPEVILEVDHIVPVAEGGANEIDNYITACFPCNRGKGAVSLDRIPQSLTDKTAEIAEREDQIRGYNEIMLAARNRIEGDVECVNRVYERFAVGYELSDSSRVSVRMFIEKLGVFPVIEAMEIAGERWSHMDSKIFRYFCGICWNKIREQK
ncbi:HNH endonuclease [Burkholderia glumae]|uniref:HNH endonuclease n=1 Tax=Burkholderia glumae TaxID=337 RepID=UPI003B99C3D0